jgi:hypothetical protein
MALAEFFNSTSMFNIGIILLVLGLVSGLYLYFSYKLAAQDHKLSSMMGLISTMAEEMQFFRSKINIRQDNNSQTLAFDRAQLAPHSFIMKQNDNSLIEVSDEDDDETTEPDEDDEESSESDEDENESSETDEDNGESDDENNIHQVLEFNPIEFSNEDTNSNLNNVKSITIDNEITFDNENIDLTTLPIPHLNQSEVENDIEQKETINLDDANIKSISITDIDDLDILDETQDYKKMNVNKLREVVVKKKLVNDASKMKKPDLLKLLGVE